MSLLIIEIYGYQVKDTQDSNMPNGGIFVSDTTGAGDCYLLRDGTTSSSAYDGWFDSVEHAVSVIEKVSDPIQIGGE